MKRIYLFLVLVILTAAISFGISSRNHQEQPLPRPCSLESLSGYLSLSSEQRHEVEPMFAEFTKKRAEIVNRRNAATRHLVSVLRSDSASRQQVAQALRAVDVEQSRLRNLTVHHLLGLKSVLNKEQTDKLFDLVNRRLCVADGQGSLACPVTQP
ncbi:MAG: periplasmic heavy metal sensor [Armatimonadota bacterium]